MPALINSRHERFARYYLKTHNASEAYRRAGFNCKTPSSVKTCASRLLTNVNVKRRLGEIRRQMTSRTRITIETLLHDLAEDRALARETKQVSAAIAATTLSAKLVGLLVDRKESGAPGDFAGLQDVDDVLALVGKELGAETAAALASVLGKHEATEAAQDLAAPAGDDSGESSAGETIN